jgi:hypothetical protein
METNCIFCQRCEASESGCECNIFPRLVIKRNTVWDSCKYRKEDNEKTVGLRALPEKNSLYSRKCGY